MGQSLFRDQLKTDAKVWTACESEWGKGPVYRDRVSDHNKAWFKTEKAMQQELQSLIEREWGQALVRVTTLFDE